MLAAFAALALMLAPQPAPPAAAPASSGRLLSNGWYYEEIGNSCMAARDAAGGRLFIRMTRWNDLSDSLLFYRPGLPPLWSEDGQPSGLTEAQEEADADAGYHLAIRIDGRAVEQVTGFNSMLLDQPGGPGPTYRFGIRQQPFLQALRTGRTLELYRKGQRLASFPIRGSRDMAARLARCIDLPLAR